MMRRRESAAAKAAAEQPVSLLDVARQLVQRGLWEEFHSPVPGRPHQRVDDDQQVARVRIQCEQHGVLVFAGWHETPSVTAADGDRIIRAVEAAIEHERELQRRDAGQAAAEPAPDRSGMTVGEIVGFLGMKGAEQALRPGGFGLPRVPTPQELAAAHAQRDALSGSGVMMGDTVGMGVAPPTDW